MSEATIIVIMKTFFINIFTYLIAIKINREQKVDWIKGIVIIIAAAIGTLIYCMLNKKVNRILLIALVYFIQILFLKFILAEGKTLIITNLISNAITYIGFTISSILEAFIKVIFKININVINLVFILIIEGLLLYLFFRMKRFAKGFNFLKNKVNNDYLDIIMANVSAVIIFAYSLFVNSNYENLMKLLIPFIIISIIMFIMIHKTLTLYYKQKLLEKNLEDYKNDISERDAKIKQLSDEKFEISKLNHEFYNRQKALEKSIKEFVSNGNLNVETASELEVMEKVNNLSKEYSNKLEKIKNPSKLPLTDITEIDDMFKYMQSECEKNNINFELRINGNIHHMVNNIIEQSRLVTLIGDHLRDAIIAVKSSNNSYRSIIAILGIKDNNYEFCVYDTGVEFEIETLIKLGVEPVTTHKDEGGTGIGFITTFETLKETNGSLIIEEKHGMTDNDYTKAVTIRFDGKHEYKICSYRAEEIIKRVEDREIIVENIA